MPMPLEIVGLGQPEVRFVWDEGDADVWSARALRLRCTCAYCQSEATGERLLDPATVAEGITVTNMSLVGNYGVSIAFSDGHSTGIYRFRQLFENRPSKS
jgi:ATP-binding protein involved in chromosome partitioning